MTKRKRHEPLEGTLRVWCGRNENLFPFMQTAPSLRAFKLQRAHLLLFAGSRIRVATLKCYLTLEDRQFPPPGESQKLPRTVLLIQKKEKGRGKKKKPEIEVGR